MTRNLKVLGLALAAMFAMSAVIASGASASEFTSFNTANSTHEGGTFSGDQTTIHVFKATASGFGEVTCAKAHFSGNSATGTETQPTVNAEYNECHIVIPILGTFPADVRMNGCHYKFHITGGAADEFTGTADVVGCETGKSIEVEITTSGGGTRKCLDTIPAQNGLNGITYKNNTGASPTDIEVVTTTNNVHNITDNSSSACGVSEGEHLTGSYTGSTTIKGFGAGGQIDLTVM